MSAGELIFMGIVVGVAILVGILAKVKSDLSKWLGFGLMLAASLVAIIGGIAIGEYRVIPLGVACLLGTLVAFLGGAVFSSATNDDAGTLGGVASSMRWWAWVTIVVLIAAAIPVTFLLPAGTQGEPTSSTQQAEHSKAKPAGKPGTR